MKKPTTRSVGRLENIRTADQKLSIPIAASFFGHLVFCLLFILLPKFSLDRSPSTHVIDVRLVAPSAPMPEPAQTVPPSSFLPEVEPVEASQPTSTPQAEKTVSTASKQKEAVSLAPKEIEKKQSMKKKTYKRERLLESALKQVEKRVETSNTDQRQQALDRIRSELKEKEAKVAVESPAATGTSAATAADDGTPISDIKRIYYAEVVFSIQRNWAFSEQLAGDEKNLYNEVGFKIMRNGEIKDVWFDRRSGNSYFDESTRKAILKSSPLPPIPDQIKDNFLELMARFTPEGIN